MLTIILAIICTILVLIGLASTILPFMPGATIAWLGLFIFAIGTGFKRISIITTIVFFVVTLLTFVFDFFAPIMIARKYKTSKLGTLGGRLGSFLSNVTLGYPWTIIGHFGGTILGELMDKSEATWPGSKNRLRHDHRYDCQYVTKYNCCVDYTGISDWLMVPIAIY